MTKYFAAKRFVGSLGILLLLSGCVNNATTAPAPVTEAWHQTINTEHTYTVQPDDTLFSIAWGFGLDYRQLAALNNISAPGYAIKVGQKLKLGAGNDQSTSEATPAPAQTTPVAVTPAYTAKAALNTNQASVSPTKPAPTNVVAPVVVATPKLLPVTTARVEGILWAWPAQGRIINTYSPTGLNKGLDIAGIAGTPVLAAASGKVVYAGNGLRGYGDLIIIKHNDEFLSAYAHNRKLFVKEGQMVKVGQVIASMGNTESKQVVLHFEIRKAGKPVDPQKYLPH